MIYLLYGEYREKAHAKAVELIDVLQKKKPDAAYFKMTDENFEEGKLQEYASSQGLFSGKYIVFLSRIFQNKNAKEIITGKLKELGESENIFIILEDKLDKATLSKIQKYAEKVQDFELMEVRNKKFGGAFNVFSLSDVFGMRDKKNLWVLYQKALLHDTAPEEIQGILFWQVKSMILSQNAGSAGEAGLSPFVYQKSKRYSGNFTEKELKDISGTLVSIYHQAHRGEHDFTVALERFILGV